jgi:DNA-cytosine methyltransferase
LLIGGSPCQGFSFAGKGLNFEDPRSKLFFEFVRLKNETQPKYWMLENVKMKVEHQNIISEILGVKPILINSELVSAQSRERLFWTNIPITELPTDRGILLKDIIELGEPIKDKSQTILATLHKENAKSMIKRNKAGLLVKMSSENPRIKELSITDRGIRPHRNDKRKSGISEIGTIHYPDTKSYTITANHAPKVLTEIIGWRKLTPKECERLQTVPDNYTDCVSDTQRYKMLGNGWTVDVIAHIFGGLS